MMSSSESRRLQEQAIRGKPVNPRPTGKTSLVISAVPKRRGLIEECSGSRRNRKPTCEGSPTQSPRSHAIYRMVLMNSSTNDGTTIRISRCKRHGGGWQVTIHPEDLGKLMDIWQRLLASGEPDEIKARLRRYEGEYRWVPIPR